MNQDSGTEILSPGGFWVRAGAVLVDAAWYSVLVRWPLNAGLSKMGAGLRTLFWLQLIVAAVVVVAFWVWKGATPGKMLCSLKIVRADGGGSPGLGRWIGRFAAYYVSLLPFGLGFFWAGWNPEKQALHDFMAGTRVVRTDTSPRANKKAWIAVGVAIAFNAALVLVPTGFLMIRALSKGQRKAFLQAVGEGRTFGLGKQDQACLDEAVHRAAGIKDVLGSVRNQAFLNGCLAVAAPTETFCADVPAEGSVLGRTNWALARVRAAGLDARNPFQRGLFDDVFRQCQKRRQGTKGAAK
jgi:uncharacterized RDD family membrane protein YckC